MIPNIGARFFYLENMMKNVEKNWKELVVIMLGTVMMIAIIVWFNSMLISRVSPWSNNLIQISVPSPTYFRF